MEFTPYVIVVLIVAFWWSGFVRAGLGFGGAGLMYPVALLAVDSVLFLVPIICVQLMLFSAITLARDHPKVNWRTTWILMAAIAPTFMLGIFGLIRFPDTILLAIVYVVTIAYSIAYLFNVHDAGPKRWWFDGPILVVGGYVSGLSLAGAPLISAVGMRYLNKTEMRASLFCVWFVLCAVKLSTLAYYDVDLQFRHQFWLLPPAIVGHLMGMRLHDRILRMQTESFYRWMGGGLLALSLGSMATQWLR